MNLSMYGWKFCNCELLCLRQNLSKNVFQFIFLYFSPSKLTESLNSMCVDDEHRLIARYAARLAADAKNAVSFYKQLFILRDGRYT